MHVTAGPVATPIRPASVICTLDDCLKAAATYYKVTPRELRSHEKWQPLAHRRLLMVYVMRANGGYSLPKIARFLKRDHTSIMYACRKMEAELPCDPDLARDHAAILEQLCH